MDNNLKLEGALKIAKRFQEHSLLDIMGSHESGFISDDDLNEASRQLTALAHYAEELITAKTKEANHG